MKKCKMVVEIDGSLDGGPIHKLEACVLTIHKWVKPSATGCSGLGADRDQCPFWSGSNRVRKKKVLVNRMDMVVKSVENDQK